EGRIWRRRGMPFGLMIAWMLPRSRGFPGVPQVDLLALLGNGFDVEPVGVDDLAVEDEVGQAVGLGSVKGFVKVRGECCAGSSARTVCSTTFATTTPSSINDGTATPRPLPFDIGRRPVVQRPGPGGAGRAGGG